MTVLPHQRHPKPETSAPASMVVAMGVPAVTGRWQPTRAGAVSSWAWTDETFLFADGWLALAGPNGSGKSLTASMLVTVLLDADTSQKALSISGDAAGTLTDRHTDRSPTDDRTGAWWLEYGMRDDQTGQLRYLTTGLWLRSQGGSLQRAFFLTPGRVGEDVHLQRDRDPVIIEDLAGQLAAADGQLFTSHDRLKTRAKPYLTPGEENSYRDAIRTTLFAPLDAVQFDALLGVLRSLRSVRTAEAISPNAMRTVLTDALPALDPRALQFIADTMQRITDLERQLSRARSEIRQLEQSEQQYQRYLDAVTAVEAAQLSHAQTLFDDHARDVRAAEDKLAEAREALTTIRGQRADLATVSTEVEGKLQATDAALRDHAGAELPQLEERLTELRNLLHEAVERRDSLAEEAESAAATALEHVGQAADAQNHLAALAHQLQAVATDVGAQAFVDRIAETGERLIAAQPGPEHPSADLPQLSATPDSWIQARLSALHAIEATVRELDLAHEAQRLAASQVRVAESERDTCEESAQAATEDRRHTEDQLLGALHLWDTRRVELPAVPAHLSVDATDRINADDLTTWLHQAGIATRQRIALAAREQDVSNAARAVQAAEQSLQRATRLREQATRASDDAELRLDLLRQQAARDHQNADDDARQARATAHEAREAAHAITRHAENELGAGRQAATRAAADWARQVLDWRTTVVQLDHTTLVVPADPDAIDLHYSASVVQQALATVTAILQHRIAGTERDISAARDTVNNLDERLQQARRQPLAPAAPPWRDARTGDTGVPLWAAVAFAPHLDAADADRLEGALLTSGLLDALITHDGRLAGPGDLTLTTRDTADGGSLADVLVAEPDGGIDPRRVTILLRSISLDEHGTDLRRGHLQVGPLNATAPRGYRAAYIGRTTRERTRLALVADLEQQLADARAALSLVEAQSRSLHEAQETARVEADAFPGGEHVTAARDHVTALQLGLAEARQRTTQALADAERILTENLAAIDATRATIDATVRTGERERDAALLELQRAQDAENGAGDTLQDTLREHEHAVERYEQAREAEARCTTEERDFPDLSDLRIAVADEDAATQTAIAARARVTEQQRLHRVAGERVSTAQKAVNTAATQSDSTVLPTSPEPLHRHRLAVQDLERQISTWASAAQRTIDLLAAAHTHQATANRVVARHSGAVRETRDLERRTTALDARVMQTRTLYGAEYTDLLATREALASQQNDLTDQDQRLADQLGSHQIAEAEAGQSLRDLAPRKAQTEQTRTRQYHRMALLVTYGFADIPTDIAQNADGTPATMTAALTWARRLLAQRQGNTRLDALTTTRDRALRQLENTTRTVNLALAEFDQQLEITTLDLTDWRRVTLAAPNAAVGDDLRQAAATLRTTVTGLENDLRHDITTILKTSTFIQLRRDIQQRREAAQELVRDIRATLENVRTGVARVGVQVDWKVREDDNAREMVALLTAPPSDAIFEKMYEVLRERMEEASDETWTDRVAHTFDYRSWHEWHISVTHSSFGPEVFKPVNARSNPLKSLSTGESRLATMLPLLAAAWSMYSGDAYRGPRLLSIDEIDAAFDDKNLRQVLALLRTWKFDVLATTPSIAPLIKRESQNVVIHEVVTTDTSHRVTVPWLWSGNGEAVPLTLTLPGLDIDHQGT